VRAGYLEDMRPHWDAKASNWDHQLPRSDLFDELLDTILAVASPTAQDVVVDLGAGTGFVTIPVAEQAARVYAVDHSRRMLEQLSDKLAARRLSVRVALGDLGRVSPPEPIDLVVSNYALHHLSHRRKRELLRRCRDWLKPGGRIVVSDLMVPLTLRPGQSGPLRRKIRSIMAKGPKGYWRIAKNLVRWALGRGEYPAGLDFWMAALREAGFVSVQGRRIGSESGVAWAMRAAG
jgi:SAM-dependent methyltransferase